VTAAIRLAPVAAAAAAPPLADLLGEKLRLAIARLAAWTGEGGSTSRPGWREQFLAWQSNDPGARFGAELDSIERQLAAAADGAMRNRLLAVFRLAPPERDLLDCAAALAADPGLADAIATLRPGAGAGALTERLVVELFAHPPLPIARPSSPLCAWSLIEAGPLHARWGQIYAIDADIAAAMFGRPGLDRRLFGCAEKIAARRLPIPSWPVAELAGELGRIVESGRSARVSIVAPDGSGRCQFAAAAAEAMGTELIRIDPEAPADEDLYMRAQRLALMTGHALYWRLPPARWPSIPAAPIQFAALRAGEPLPRGGGPVDLRVALPPLAPNERKAVWGSLFGQGGAAPGGRGLTGARLGDLLAAAATAAAADDALPAVRAAIRDRLEGSGQLLEQPYDWDDLVLPARAWDLLKGIAAEIRGRDRVLDGGGRQAKYGGIGQSALFWGAPGTGKTMAAQVLARELGVELVRVDLAATLSKYIGETAKNLREAFDRVAGSGAILFFDEADALFARRTDVKDSHDRHANADTNYLLQLIEGFDGIAILATNKKENLDPAFIRRLRHVVDFTAGGARERRLVWERHIAALSDRELPGNILALWSEQLAAIDLTPAQIKGAALSAAFARIAAGADVPDIHQLIAGADRELAKEGRAVDRNLRAEIARHGR